MNIFSCIKNKEAKPIDVKVFLDKPTTESKAKLKDIFSDCSNLEIKEAKGIDKRFPYLIVSDSKRFRISPQIDGTKGVANFNKPDVGEALSKAFLTAWNS
jgi:hypothetical protein